MFKVNFIDNKINKATTAPAIVIGTPLNTPSNSVALYLANLKAPQIGKQSNNA